MSTELLEAIATIARQNKLIAELQRQLETLQRINQENVSEETEMTYRCLLSEAELKHDGGGTMSEAEWTRRYNEALVKDRVVAQVWDVLCDIAPSDQREIVRLLLSVGGERDFTAAGRLIFRHIFMDTDKIVSDEINLGD